MAIVKKTLKDVSVQVKTAYTKALQVRNQSKTDGNISTLQYSIALFKAIVQNDPGFLDARQQLRDAEREYAGKISPIAKFFANFKGMKFAATAMSMAAKKPEEALKKAEEALSLFVFNTTALNAMCEAGKKLEAPFICVEAYELIVEKDDKNELNVEKLGNFYREAGQGVKYLQIRQKLAAKYPDDLEKLALLREAAALASMERGKWDDNKKKDQDFTKNLNKDNNDQGDRIIRAEDDIRDMIAKFKEDIAAGNESIDLRRQLADLQLRSNQYEDAIETYNWIVNRMGTLDPAIDKAIEKANVLIAQREIEKMQQEGKAQEEIDAKKKAIYDYRMERYHERIRKYPNDLQIRFEYAELLWDGGDVDGSLEQFQLAQRNPQHRLTAIVYLGRCFAAKRQFDMSIEQFTHALSDMPTMTPEKMDTLYYLGCTYESMGKGKEAVDCFKQIYSVDIKFKDVEQKINSFYAQKNA